MTDPNRTDVIYVLDESGSMWPQEVVVRDVFEQQIKENHELPGDVYVSLTTFNTEVTVHYTSLRLKKVPPLLYHPVGRTALNDALAQAVNTTGARFAALPEQERPQHVVMFVMTDGLENASKEFSRKTDGVAKVKAMIEHQTNKYAWQFVFLGQGLDVQVGHDLGIENSVAPEEISAAMSLSSTVLRRVIKGEQLDVDEIYKGT